MTGELSRRTITNNPNSQAPLSWFWGFPRTDGKTVSPPVCDTPWRWEQGFTLNEPVEAPGCLQEVYTPYTLGPDPIKAGAKWWHQRRKSTRHSCHSEFRQRVKVKGSFRLTGYQLRGGFSIYRFTQRWWVNMLRCQRKAKRRREKNQSLQGQELEGSRKIRWSQGIDTTLPHNLSGTPCECSKEYINP